MDLNVNEPTWLSDLRQSIWSNWWPHGPNRTMHWCIESDDEGGWIIRACPVYQEIYGGERDGEIVWTPYTFDGSAFLQQIEDDFRIEGFSIASFDERLDTQPMFLVKADREGVVVTIAIHMEPPKEKIAVEIIDTITGAVRFKNPELD